MIKGFYAAVSGMVLNAGRHHLLSHNVANLSTPGFKQVLANAETFLHTQVIYSPGNLDGSGIQRPIGMLGLGAASGLEQVDFTQGGLQMTSNPLDFAIQGNGFFRVNTPQGERFTRDGRFVRDAANQLVTVEGFALLDQNGQPIAVPDGDVSLSPEGVLSVNGVQAAQIGLAAFDNPEVNLLRDRGNYYRNTTPALDAGEARLAQGYLEMSNANPTLMMAQLVEVGRSYEAAQQMVQNQDELLGKTISSLGRLG